MMTITGIRNALWCTLAFAIVACASAPMRVGDFASEQAAGNRDAGSGPSTRGVEIIASNVTSTTPRRMVGTP